MLLGLKGLVIKSHGSADKYAFYIALVRAYEAAKNKMVENIEKAFEHAESLVTTAPLQSNILPTTQPVEIKS
jgi:fatty acid/phospholipid biosynthesis enzyme